MSNNESRPLIRRNMALEEVLQLATPDELAAIASILLDKENSRIFGDDNARQRLARSSAERELYKVVNEIAFEIRALGSVSLASLLRRGEPVSYDEIVRDVAGELTVKYTKTDTTWSIEEKVLEMLVEKLAEQVERERKIAPGSSYGQVRVKSPFASFFEPLSKVYLGTTGATIASSLLGSVAGVGLLGALPLAAVSAVTAGVLVARNKARPELSGLTMIVVHIARIRVGVAAADHEDFIDRLRACL